MQDADGATSQAGVAPEGPDAGAAADVRQSSAEEDVAWNQQGSEPAPWQSLTLFLALLTIVAGAAVYMHTRRAGGGDALEPDDDGEWPLPPLVIQPRPVHAGPAGPRAAPPEAAEASPAGPARWIPDRQAAAAAAPATPAPAATAGSAVPGRAVQDGRARVDLPADGRLQLLPGRLDLVRGDDEPGEVRFVRVPGQVAEVTFGRSEGRPHLHIQLQSPTVSRLHASMRFDNNQWHITNLSQTNPVVLNGVRMDGAERRSVVLADGDRIEMGEVTFQFRSR